MAESDQEEPKILCGVCGLEISPGGLCYEIRYGTLMNNRFSPQETYMLVHSACLKE